MAHMSFQEIVDRETARFPPFLVGSWPTCAYCGESSQCRDHVWPVSFITSMDRRISRNLVFQIGPQVLACHRCNTKLSNRFFDTFQERCRFIANWKIKRAAKISAYWTSPELRQLQGRLQAYVLEKQREKQLLQKQIDWYWSEEFFRNLEGLILEPLLISAYPQFHEHYFEYFRTTIECVKSCVDFGKVRQGET